MVESRVGQQLVQRVNRARLGIGGAVNEPGNAGLQNRPGAHRARFQRHVKHAIVEPPATQRFGGLGDGNHLGVGCWVAQLLALVVSRSDDSFAMYNYRANWDLVFVKSLSGLIERTPEK